MPPRQPVIARTRAALVLLALLAVVGCSQDRSEGIQPELGGEVTQPEQGVAQAGEPLIAPGAGVEDPAEQVEGADQAADSEQGDRALVEGAFAGIPLPTAAQPLTGATVEDDVTVQSFEVTATSPEQVIDFYRDRLPELGWEQGQENASGQGEPEQIQATWTKDGQTLLVTAVGLDEFDSQLTLQLSGV